MQRVVIVGNGIAGMTAADTLRAEGYEGQITLVGDEQHAPYSRPALSKSLLRDAQDLESHLLPPPSHGAEELRGLRATGLDTSARLVRLEHGESLPYDSLIIATGVRSRRLGAGQADAPEELTVRTINDAVALRDRIVGQPSVIVVGGGPLGMELASGCLETGCDVTVVNQGPPLALQLGKHLSDIFVRAASSRGLKIVDTESARLLKSGERTRVELADRSTLQADLVITAVGDVPNVEWLEGSGLLRDGMLVGDERGRVGKNIVAVGDVVAVPTPLGIRRVPLWSAAIDQAKAAATALVREDARPPGHAPYFWTEQFGLSLKAVGHLPLPGQPTLLEAHPAQDKYLLRWDGATRTTGAAAAVNYRMPIPKLRRLAAGAP